MVIPITLTIMATMAIMGMEADFITVTVNDMNFRVDIWKAVSQERVNPTVAEEAASQGLVNPMAAEEAVRHTEAVEARNLTEAVVDMGGNEVYRDQSV